MLKLILVSLAISQASALNLQIEGGGQPSTECIAALKELNIPKVIEVCNLTDESEAEMDKWLRTREQFGIK